ncbi:MAG: LiaF transmembrane domain-containing protein [Thermanaerothrix sp.]|jgi:hypothetical protein|uniref:LiaF transmembrane domain-containing protein n=1 Tax=Thermanaerothrix sp. TaxID=2972675 RepID=UPI002ADDDC06|nr:DUF5668 domain-containing protein [Thermanaerothrix sp.]
MDAKRPSLFFPLLLIAIGVIFLLNNLEVIRVNGADLFLRYWPVLFIIGGLDHIYQGKGWTWGVFSILLGGIFLLANLGYLPLGGWELLLRLWPIFLIALGLDLVLRERPAWASALALFVTLGLVVGITWFAVGQARLPANAQPLTYTLPAGVRTAEVTVEQPLGQLEIGGVTAGRNLLEGEITLPRALTLTEDVQTRGSTAQVRLGAVGSTVVFPWSLGPSRSLWRLRFNPQVDLVLNLKSGLGSQVLDLRGLQVRQLTSEVALGSLTVTLPVTGDLRADLRNPIGFTTLYVPRQARVELRIDRALATLSLPPDITCAEQMCYTPGTTAVNADLRLNLEQPMGGVRVEYLP